MDGCASTEAGLIKCFSCLLLLAYYLYFLSSSRSRLWRSAVTRGRKMSAIFRGVRLDDRLLFSGTPTSDLWSPHFLNSWGSLNVYKIFSILVNSYRYIGGRGILPGLGRSNYHPGAGQSIFFGRVVPTQNNHLSNCSLPVAILATKAKLQPFTCYYLCH